MKTRKGAARLTSHASRSHLGRLLIACVASPSILYAQVAAPVSAQSTGSEETKEATQSNQRVLEQWNSKASEDKKAALVTAEDGKSTVVFAGGANLDAYRNTISSATGKLGTGAQAGNLYKLVTDFEIRSETQNEGTTYLQTAIASSDDRSAIPRYHSQLTNFQVGHKDKSYEVQLGDIGINYSTLGANIGFKGARVQKTLGSVSTQLFLGTIAESWEALTGRAAIDGNPPRQKYLTEVKGIKLDWQATSALKTFVTLQGRNDLETSVTESLATVPGKDAVSYSAGLAWQQGDFGAAAEWSASQSAASTDPQNKAKANAAVIDGTWRLNKVSTRFGYHKVGGQFVTVGSGAQPGVEELYASADWQANDWLQLGAESRDSKQRIESLTVQPSPVSTPTDPGMPAPLSIAPVPAVAASSNNVKAHTLRANISLQPILAGASIVLNGVQTRSQDALSNAINSHATNVQLGLQREQWGGTLGYALNTSRNFSSPSADSEIHQSQIGLQWRPWQASPDAASQWAGNLGLNYSHQKQLLLTTAAMNITNSLAVNFSVQHPRYGSTTIGLQEGSAQQMGLTPKLVQRMTQLEWNKTLTAISDKTNLKLFFRNSARNIGDDRLKVTEKALGTTLNVRF